MDKLVLNWELGEGDAGSPGEPGHALIFSLWQLTESFSRRAISLSYYNASLKHNSFAESLVKKKTW